MNVIAALPLLSDRDGVGSGLRSRHWSVPVVASCCVPRVGGVADTDRAATDLAPPGSQVARRARRAIDVVRLSVPRSSECGLAR